MTLTIKKLPQAISMIENGLICQVQREPFKSPNARAYRLLTIPPGLQGQIEKLFTLTFAGQDFEFFFVDEPEDSGYELTRWKSDVSRAAFVNNLITELRKCYPVGRAFHMLASTGHGGIFFEAYEYGPDYNIDVKETNITDLSVSNLVAGNLNTPDPGYKIYLGLARELKNQIIAEELVPVNFDLMATADFKIYIRSWLQTSFTFPYIAPGDKVITLPDSTLLLKLVYAEHEENRIRRLNYSSQFLVIPGGLSDAVHSGLKQNNHDYFADLNGAFKFLNWCAPTKLTAWQIPERLYFLPQNDDDDVVASAKIYYTDDTPTETIVLGAVDSDSKNKIIEIICGLHEIKPDVDPATVSHYEVYCFEDDDQVSEVKTFVVDQKPVYRRRCFIFKNSFGVYETLMCTGQMTVSDNYSSEMYDVYLNGKYRRQVERKQATQTYLMHSGWVDYQTREWLQDFLISKEVYLVSGQQLIKVNLLDGEVLRHKDLEFLHAIAFELSPVSSEELYSSDEISDPDYVAPAPPVLPV